MTGLEIYTGSLNFVENYAVQIQIADF